MGDENSPQRSSERRRNFIDSILAGLIANALTATFVVLVAMAGGRVQVLRGCAVLALVLLGLLFLATPIFAVRDYRRRTLPREINLGRLIVGGSILGVTMIVFAVDLAQYVFR